MMSRMTRRAGRPSADWNGIPSGEIASEFTGPKCPSKKNLTVLPVKSQTLILLSTPEAASSVPSGEKTRSLMKPPDCFGNGFSSRPVFASQAPIAPSWNDFPFATSVWPSGLNFRIHGATSNWRDNTGLAGGLVRNEMSQSASVRP